MKNTSKKSKFVILPALATLVLTSVATVTGTAAWFTAARTASVSGSFISTKTDSNLKVELTAGTGTSITTGKAVNVQGKMTHGSYNANKDQNGSLYVASLDDGNKVTAYLDKKNLANNTNTVEEKTTYYWAAKYDSTTASESVWYGVSWTMKFKYNAYSDGETNYLLFSPKESTIGNKKITNESGETTTTKGDTYKGFRIALMGADKYLVVGGDSEKTHVTGTSSTSDYDEAHYEDLNASDKSEKLPDNDQNITKGKYSFGAIDDTNGVTITCVAWFEGEDKTSIVNQINKIDVVMSEVAASLSFYTRSMNAKI